MTNSHLPQPGDQIMVLNAIRTIHPDSPLAGKTFKVLAPSPKYKRTLARLAREGGERTDTIVVAFGGEAYEVEPEFAIVIEPVMTFEYCQVQRSEALSKVTATTEDKIIASGKDFITVLNILGACRWELICATRGVMYLKRPVADRVTEKDGIDEHS